MLCKSCHYPLKQLSEPRCPECGRGFDPDNSNTYFVPPDHKPRRWLRRLIFCAIIYLVVFTYVLHGEITSPSRGIAFTNGGVVTYVSAPISVKILRSAIASLLLLPVAIVVALLFSVSLSYARQLGVGLYKAIRWPYDDEPPLRS